MDKEIIIDGVDISECSYAITPKRQCPNKPMPYAKETSCIGCKEHNTKLNFCKNNPDCYFKQLKRLQAENEKLKTDIAIYKGIIDTDKAENERLKEEIRTEKIYSSQIEELEESLQHAKAENERLKKEVETWNYQADKRAELSNIWFNTAEKYKQALQEIREIAEKMYYTNDEDTERDLHIELQDKINEVVGGVDET